MLHVEALKKLESGVRNQVVQNEDDERVENKRFLRILQDEQFELDMEKAIQKVSFTIHCCTFFTCTLKILKDNH
jgi:hypothetical protein